MDSRPATHGQRRDPRVPARPPRAPFSPWVRRGFPRCRSGVGGGGGSGSSLPPSGGSRVGFRARARFGLCSPSPVPVRGVRPVLGLRVGFRSPPWVPSPAPPAAGLAGSFGDPFRAAAPRGLLCGSFRPGPRVGLVRGSRSAHGSQLCSSLRRFDSCHSVLPVQSELTEACPGYRGTVGSCRPYAVVGSAPHQSINQFHILLIFSGSIQFSNDGHAFRMGRGALLLQQRTTLSPRWSRRRSRAHPRRPRRPVAAHPREAQHEDQRNTENAEKCSARWSYCG